MRNQQAQEREEQQRIKNLVLNLDLRESDDQDSKSQGISRRQNTNSLTFHLSQAMNPSLLFITTITKPTSLPGAKLSVGGSFNLKILSGMRILQICPAIFLAKARADDCQSDCQHQLAGKAK